MHRCDAGQRPVADAGRAERAAVADAAGQDPPGERQLIAVLPDDPHHLAIVVRLLLAQAEEGVQAADVILPRMAGRERMQRIPVVRVGDGPTSETSTDDVAVEAALEVRLNGQPFSVTMRTPGADRELAAGFLFTEGIVTAATDIVAVHVDPSADVVDVILTRGASGGGGRAARCPASGDDDVLLRHVRTSRSRRRRV